MIGENVEGKVLGYNVAEYDGRTYYQFELEPPHVFITATAAGNRLYLFNVTGSGINFICYSLILQHEIWTIFKIGRKSILMLPCMQVFNGRGIMTILREYRVLFVLSDWDLKLSDHTQERSSVYVV